MTKLTTGIKFDTKRFKSDIELFQKKQNKKQRINANDIQSSSVFQLPNDAQLPDFFASKQQKQTNVEASELQSKSQQQLGSDTNDTLHLIKSQDIEDFKDQEELALFRKRKQIRIYGNNAVVDPVKSLMHLQEQYQIQDEVVSAMMRFGYHELSAVQLQAIPLLLQGKDVICCAPTGSGKSLAYLIPILHKFAILGASEESGDDIKSNNRVKALILTPSRELASQIEREIAKILPFSSKLTYSQYQGVDKQLPHLLVSTPLRLMNALKNDSLDLSSVECVVIDEADKMFNDSLLKQLDCILAACNRQNVQKCLFSATINSDVELMAMGIMKNPVRVVIGTRHAANDQIDQKLLYVGQEEGKMMALRNLIHDGIKPPVLIFVETIERAKMLYQSLSQKAELHVDVFHSELSADERELAIKKFRKQESWILITTDLLGRGIDFKGVRMVINYDFPPNAASYIHRIGRTGRGKQSGTAVTFFLKSDACKLRSIANVMKSSGCEVPEWMLKLPREKDAKRRKLQKFVAKGKQQQQKPSNKAE
ncbi:hypothetical protein MP228_012390 [Amoeboaphelidium protococcarum]|nr:hypothetical protein MP228_012390 [Amoeboaphelidium protococcarum]